MTKDEQPDTSIPIKDLFHLAQFIGKPLRMKQRHLIDGNRYAMEEVEGVICSMNKIGGTPRAWAVIKGDEMMVSINPFAIKEVEVLDG